MKGLVLDHVIIRSARPEHTLEELQEAGFPALAPPETLGGGMRSGIVRAGPVDLEVLAVGVQAPAVPHGYGLGFVAPGQDLLQATRLLRAAGVPTSTVLSGQAGRGPRLRKWRVIQLGELLPDPFRVPFTTRPPSQGERVVASVLALAGRIPMVARVASRGAGSSMVVLTQYDFDAEAWRAEAPPGPAVVAVEVGAGELAENWARLGPLGGPRLSVRPDAPVGVRRITVSGPGWDERRTLQLGAITLTSA